MIKYPTVSSMKTKTIKTEYRKVVVKKLPLGEYAEFFKQIMKLTKHFKSTDELNEEAILKKLPLILEDSPDIAINIIALASDLTEEEAKTQIGLDDAFDIFQGILEVNNYSKVFDRVKKMMAQRTQKK